MRIEYCSVMHKIKKPFSVLPKGFSYLFCCRLGMVSKKLRQPIVG